VESTIYVKGMRKRTESSGVMGMGGFTAIEQCDLKRTIKLNDRKKLYFIEAFNQENEDLTGDEKDKQVLPSKQQNVNQKGGVITMWYSITDTGERKKMYGFTARHVWTSQKMKPSPDACSMKDSLLIKTDGWYIDLPQFNCPVGYHPERRANERTQPDCIDKYVMHRQGNGKLGFPLAETVIMIMGNSKDEVRTSMETVELSTDKLDSMLFEIPQGYELAKSEEELLDKMDVQEMMNNAVKNKQVSQPNEEKKAGTIRIGVFAPSGNDQVQSNLLQQHLVQQMSNSNIEALAVNSEEEAKKMNCDYTLSSVFTNIKQGDKAKGLLKAITRGDPNAMSSFNVQADMTLKTLKDGSVKNQQSLNGKYDGKIDEAATKALDEGCQRMLKAL